MKGFIPKPFIQDVIARTDIVEIVQARVTLTKRGNNYLACCPFHTEKTPSFSVNPQKQFYYCFGCSAHGNAIGFLMAYDKMEFVDAIEYLASQLGLEIPYENGSKPTTSYDDFYPLLERTTQYYEQQLREHQPAIQYLKTRGLTGQVAKFFRIGFAPSGWQNLETLIEENSNDKDLLIRNGLIIEKDAHKSFDRFRHRIMFPIRDTRGRVIAFGGRTMGDDQPKYMNSPETPVFHKSNELYGLYEALQKNRKLTKILVVEGYMDVIMLAQHRLHFAAATLGTAINAKHLQKLFRYTNNIIFCFDGDNAGRQAAWKALTISLPTLRDGIDIRFLFLPQGEDPDSLVQKIGPNAFEDKIQQAKPLADFFFSELYKNTPLNSAAQKAQFAKEALSYLEKMPSGIYQQLLQKRLSDLLQIDLPDTATHAPQEKYSHSPPRRKTASRLLTPLQIAIAILLQYPEFSKSIREFDFSYLQHFRDTHRDLLLKLIELLQTNEATSTGGLLAYWDEPEDQAVLARLAATELPIPTAGIHTELLGALSRLRQQAEAQQAQDLIQKARATELSEMEKNLLRELLAKKHQVESSQ